jgi:hypothetical protein
MMKDDTRAVDVHKGDKIIEMNEGLGPRWPNSNSWEKCEGDEDSTYQRLGYRTNNRSFAH